MVYWMIFISVKTTRIPTLFCVAAIVKSMSPDVERAMSGDMSVTCWSVGSASQDGARRDVTFLTLEGPGGPWGPGALGPWGAGCGSMRLIWGNTSGFTSSGSAGHRSTPRQLGGINTPTTNTMEPSAPPRETGHLSSAASRGQGSSAVSTLTVFTFYSIFTLKCRP